MTEAVRWEGLPLSGKGKKAACPVPPPAPATEKPLAKVPPPAPSRGRARREHWPFKSGGSSGAGRRAGSARSCAELAGDVGRRFPGSLSRSLRPAPCASSQDCAETRARWGAGRAEPSGGRRALWVAPGPGHGQRELGAQGAPRDRAAGALSQTKAQELRLLSGTGPRVPRLRDPAAALSQVGRLRVPGPALPASSRAWEFAEGT